MKVAVVKTGPGVNCPTATASISCCSVSQWRWLMNSALRNASSTYPLPKTTDPIFRNERNNRIKLTGTNAVIAAVPANRAKLLDSGTAAGAIGFCGSTSKAPEGLQDDRDHSRFYAVQNAGDLRQRSEANVNGGNQSNQNGG